MPDPADRPSPIEALAAGVAAVVHGPDLDQGLGTLLAGAVATLGASSALISLQDPDRPDPELALTVGLDDSAQAAAVDAVADAEHPLTAAGRERTERRSDATIGLPLITARGGIEEPLGAIALIFPSAEAADEADTGLLQLVADIASLAVDRARLSTTAAERSEWFERLANTDALTGLANARTIRRVLELELTRAGRQAAEVSVALFDIDDFGALNEAAGRAVGDDVLRSVASVLAGSVRLVDTVARFGADEFLLVAPGPAGTLVAQRVLDGIGEIAPADGHAVRLTAGVARYPADGVDADAVVAAARTALDRARAERSGAAIVEASATEPSGT